MAKLNAKELRVSEPTKEEVAKIKRNPIYLVLDRIIDTYNTGSLFRLADAIGVEKMYLCGDMEYPPLTKIHRAAVGTDKWVPWEKRETTLKAIKELKKKGVQILVVEQDSRAVSYKDIKPKFPVAIVVGNEMGGIEKEILDEADLIVELPMFGINKSFNVWGSAAVICYKVIEFIKK